MLETGVWTRPQLCDSARRRLLGSSLGILEPLGASENDSTPNEACDQVGRREEEGGSKGGRDRSMPNRFGPPFVGDRLGSNRFGPMWPEP